MTSEFSDFVARLREFMQSTERGLQNAQDGGQPRLLGAGSPGPPFNELAVELFRLQFAHNPPYRQFCQARGVLPRNLTSWMQIPAVPAPAFREFALSCLPETERTTVFHSSGTTGQPPSRHSHNTDSLAIYEASLLPWFWAHLLADCRLPTAVCQSGGQFDHPANELGTGNWRLAILTPPPTQASHSSLAHMFETVRRKLGAPESVFVGRAASDGAWTLDLDAALGLLRNGCEGEQPLILLGTAFSFVHLLDSLAQRNLPYHLPPGSRAMETGGYKGRSRSLPKLELHALITQRLGIPPTHIVCEYGMSELSSQAYDRVAGGGCRVSGDASVSHLPSCACCRFRFPPWARVRVVSPETGCEVAEGEAGLIQVVDLANVFSVAAVRTEDLGLRRGDGFELLGRAVLAEARGCSLLPA